MAHDICSIAACNIAFEDCKEEEGYDLGEILYYCSSFTYSGTDAAWQLIGLCAWVVKCTETLLKAAVLCNSSGIAQTPLGGKI